MQKMKSNILLVLITLFIASCSDYDKKMWTKFNGTGIDEGSFRSLMFVNDSIGYLGGENSYYNFDNEGQLKSFTDSTLLFKTVNGGRNWEKVRFNEAGAIRDIKIFNNKLYVLSQSTEIKSKIFTFADQEETWKLIAEFEKEDYVRDFELTEDGSLLVIINNNSNVTLLKIGQKIDTLKTFPPQNYHARINNGKAIMLYTSGGIYSDGLLIYDYYSERSDTIPFKEKLWYESSYFNKNNDFYIGVKDDKKASKILKLSNKKFLEISLDKYSNYSLGQIYVRDSLIFINSNKPENVGPIGVTHELLYSTNGGQNWQVQNYPFSLMVTPAYLKNNGSFISYTGMKEFQEINTVANSSFGKSGR